ncbi:hypothetical protein [Streptomyces sp. HUAS TT3]|uniref:hypothetical protein n=1 Tax=Streptomyces sp. HUAS TT3 TaxID=3447510 RepID=UPI003F658C16
MQKTLMTAGCRPGRSPLMPGAFAIVAACALPGGWAGLTGIVITAVILIGFAATRM